MPDDLGIARGRRLPMVDRRSSRISRADRFMRDPYRMPGLILSAIEIFKTTIEAMSMANFTLNDRPVDIDIDESTPLLWVLRDTLKLNGTKFGCGLAQCGACTVHLDGQAIRSCITPVAAIEGRSVKTIESIGEDKVGSAVQQAWIEHDVPQCRLLPERADHERGRSADPKHRTRRWRYR